jgi:hypothetical protein
MCAGATLCVECDTCGFCHVEPPLYRLANGYSSAAVRASRRILNAAISATLLWSVAVQLSGVSASG